MSTIYRRTESNWISGKGANVSTAYWRCAARRIFAEHPEIEAVEIVKTGNKLDSSLLRRGDRHSPSGFAVVIASTGGKFGKSRMDFYPAQ